MNQGQLKNRLLEIFKGNREALDFAWRIAALSECWDDLIDKDKPISDETINAAFWDALIEIPANGFYRAHFHALQPIVANSIIQWHAANEMQKKGQSLDIAHILRYLGVSIWVQIALIIGGLEWATKHTKELWEMTTKEPLNDFLKVQNENFKHI